MGYRSSLCPRVAWHGVSTARSLMIDVVTLVRNELQLCKPRILSIFNSIGNVQWNTMLPVCNCTRAGNECITFFYSVGNIVFQ